MDLLYTLVRLLGGIRKYLLTRVPVVTKVRTLRVIMLSSSRRSLSPILSKEYSFVSSKATGRTQQPSRQTMVKHNMSTVMPCYSCLAEQHSHRGGLPTSKP